MYLKSKFLNTAAFLLDKANEGQEDTRTTAQKERDAIQVQDSTNGQEENQEQQEEQQEEENEENEEENEEVVEGESEEDKAKRIEAARVEKEERKAARQQRKWDRLAAEKTAAEKERDALKKQLAEKTVEGLSEEEVERRAELKAAEKLKVKSLEDEQKAFEKNCDSLERAAIKIDPKFGDKVVSMVQEIGAPIPRAMMNIMADLDNENGGDVLNYLVNNIDEAEDIYEMTERKMTIRLTRISDKLKAEKKPTRPARERSNLPDPITPVNEGGGKDILNGPLTGKEDQETFNRKRARMVEQRRRERGY